MDTSYSLGGELVYDNGQNKLVVFHMTKGVRDGLFYHRGYDLKERNMLFDEYFALNYWRVFHRINFPPLGTQNTRAYVTNNNELVYVEHEDAEHVRIRDNRLGVRIILYKPAQQSTAPINAAVARINVN